MRAWILSTLLHHANRTTKSDRFYAIKDRLLERYGQVVGHDVQHIPGKRCFTCGGTGVYTGYYWESGDQWQDTCNRCWGGWYKPPEWNLLELKSFGKFRFHKPVERFYNIESFNCYCEKNDIAMARPFEGYVNHRASPYGKWAVLILHILFERRFPPVDVGYGLGWPCYWWKFRNWPTAACHLAYQRFNAMPFQDMRKRRNSRRQTSPIPKEFYGSIRNDDFPF